MTPVQALDILEDRMQHILASIPIHVHIKQMIESVRQEAAKDESKKNLRKKK